MNKIASAVLFDVGCRKLSTSEDSFFFQSKRCLARLILRKMFSEDNDEMGVILFGSEKTENCMPESEQEKYASIRELGRFGKPNFQLYDDVESVTQCKGYRSDWVRGVIVALEYLRLGIQGKRYKTRQIVIFSEFPSTLDYPESMLTTIAGCMMDLKVSLTVVGPNLEENDMIPDNFKPLVKLLELIEDPLKLTIDELAESIKNFEKKRKTKRVFNVELEIGSKIKIPVSWVKLTSDSQRFTNWVSKKYIDEMNPGKPPSQVSGLDGETSVKLEDNMDMDEDTKISSVFSRDITEAEDVFKVAKFGSTEVTFSAADLQALKRESGPPSFKVLAFAKRNLINPTLYVGEDIFGVMPRDKSNFSQAQLYALIDGMKKKNKVAITRRIVMRNGKVQLGVLIPFSDDCGKHLYFLKLPTVEWAQPYPRHRGYPQAQQSLKDSFKQLINSMRLDADLVEEGQGLLVPNPHYQLRCQLFAQRASDPSCDISAVPDYIKRIINPCSEFCERTDQVVKDIIKALPSLNSLARKEISEKRAQESSLRRAKARGSKSQDVNVKTEDDSFHTAKLADSTDELLNSELKQEINDEEDEDVQLFNGLIDKLAKDVNFDIIEGQLKIE